VAVNLSLKQKTLLGLDISSSAVKLVELSASGRNDYRVERYAIEVLPKDAVVDGNIANPDAVQSAIRKAWKRMGTSIKNVAVALPTTSIISKKILAPAGLREDELEGLVESEASQNIPFAIDEVSLDFRVLGPAPGSADDEEVLIVATRRDRVEDRIAVIEAVGLHPVVVDVESYATLAASELIIGQLRGISASSVVALVDIGMNALRFTVLKDNVPIYTREQAFGGGQLTQDVARRFNMEYTEAETSKRAGTLPEEYAADLLPHFTENLVLEVARSLQFFFTTTRYSSVDRIVLAGGCAAIPGVAEQVAARTQVDTVVANPFAGMVISDKIRASQLQSEASSLMVACGLALRRFDENAPDRKVCVNLLPYREEQLQERRKQFVVAAVIAFAVGAFIVFAGVVLNNMALENQQTTNKFLDDEIGNSKKLSEEINSIRAQTQALLGRKAAIETLQKDRGNVVHLFNELMVKVPESVYLTSLKQQGQEIQVSGVTQSQSRVAELMRNITASPWIGNPRLNEIKGELRGGRRFFVFSLRFAMEANPDAAAVAAAEAENAAILEASMAAEAAMSDSANNKEEAKQ